MFLRLHHIGIVVSDLEAAAREYIELMGCSYAGDVVHDPLQTARARFLQLSGTAHCIELVTPDGEQSTLAQAAKRGGGLHHLCYETDDLERSCAALRDAGLVLLHEPAPAVAFGGRRIAWLMGRYQGLIELRETGGIP